MSSRHFYSLGLIGYPLGHSLSPQIHHAALHELGLKGEYRLYPVPPFPEGQPLIEVLLEHLCLGGIRGLNVTIPHKQNVIPLLDELTPIAQAIGAVNTIFRRGDRLIGDNTDAPGFLADLERFAGSALRQENGIRNTQHAMVFGSGGGARAVVYALSSTGWNVTIIPARKEDEGQARDLAADIQSKIEDREATIISMLYSPTPPVSQAPKLIVNCTPLGMSPNVEASPWPEGVSFPRGAVVYDLVYNPSVTKFMAAARAAGLAASTGLGMLVSQAALSFERWTGLKPPFDPMFRAASEALETVPHR